MLKEMNRARTPRVAALIRMGLISSLASAFVAACAAPPTVPAERTTVAEGMCEKIVREHRGHPGKGIDVLVRKQVPCPAGDKQGTG